MSRVFHGLDYFIAQALAHRLYCFHIDLSVRALLLLHLLPQRLDDLDELRLAELLEILGDRGEGALLLSRRGLHGKAPTHRGLRGRRSGAAARC